MKTKRQCTRRLFLGLTAASGMTAVARAGSVSPTQEGAGIRPEDEEEGVAGQDRTATPIEEPARAAAHGKREIPASHPIRLLADTFVQWQTPCGRLDPQRCPLATYGHKRTSHNFMCISMYRVYEATGIQAYKEAADRFAIFYLSVLCPIPELRPAHYGFGMIAYREFKRHHPKFTDWDSKAASLFQWNSRYRWNQGSYYRNGYGGGKMEDAANSTDNAHAGRGLMAYYAATGKPQVLAEAEGLARYYITEVKPGTYQGCWSSKLGTWVVAPTTQNRFEHFENVCACEMAWGFSAIEAIDFLTQLAAATKNKDLKARLAQKCASAMKWQFDACQFDDGACGMSGHDAKWVGMTAGAVLSFLRNRDAGFLSEQDTAAYRPKVQAAAQWLLKNITPQSIQNGGYFPVTGKSHAGPRDCRAWHLAWGLEALLRTHEI